MQRSQLLATPKQWPLARICQTRSNLVRRYIFFKNSLLRLSARSQKNAWQMSASTCQTAWRMLVQAGMTNNLYVVQLTIAKFAKLAQMHQTSLFAHTNFHHTRLLRVLIFVTLDLCESQLQRNIGCLVNASTRQDCRNLGQYSHSQNQRASCRCLSRPKVHTLESFLGRPYIQLNFRSH